MLFIVHYIYISNPYCKTTKNVNQQHFGWSGGDFGPTWRRQQCNFFWQKTYLHPIDCCSIMFFHRKIEYLVRWKRSEHNDDDSIDGSNEEWVPAAMCNCPTAIAIYEKAQGVNYNWWWLRGIQVITLNSIFVFVAVVERRIRCRRDCRINQTPQWKCMSLNQWKTHHFLCTLWYSFQINLFFHLGGIFGQMEGIWRYWKHVGEGKKHGKLRWNYCRVRRRTTLPQKQ